VNVAFVLASYRRDAPAGMERSVAALCAGLRQLGHRVVVLSGEDDPDVVRLHSLDVAFPCDDAALRAATAGNRHLAQEIESILARLDIDVVSYVDALWGLGLVPSAAPARRVLMVHVIGHPEDLRKALELHPDVVIAPSRVVLTEAGRAGYATRAWRVVPNALLVADPPVPAVEARRRLRADGPVRVLARLGPEKGVHALLESAPRRFRRTEIALAAAGFEPELATQDDLMRSCRTHAASHDWLDIRPSLRWCDVPAYLAGGAVVVVPSYRETFGLVALEAMSVGTPVVARAVGNLPRLIGTAGLLVSAGAGDHALWNAARRLMVDADLYAEASPAGIERARPYRPVEVARRWLAAVS
jgi:glycosyltransferase involved in cell wall biosynthesis